LVFRILYSLLIGLGVSNPAWSQSYHVVMGGLGLYELEVTNHNSCTFDYIGSPSPGYGCAGLSSTPDSLLIIACAGSTGVNTEGFEEINQINGWYSDYFDWNWVPNTAITGVASVGGGIFYAMKSNLSNSGTGLYIVNVNTATVVYLGDLPYTSIGEMTLYNGELYYPWHTGPTNLLAGVVKINVSDPGMSELIVTVPPELKARALTATDICNTLLTSTYAFNNDHMLYYINLIDGVITPLCQAPLDAFNISTLLEFEDADYCPVYLDLDNDDSAGLPEADFQSDEFDCHSDGVPVSDEDIHVLYDALIMEMTIEIVGFIPDGPSEILEMSGSVPNIDVIGNGTGMITLINIGGAKSTDFKDALRQIMYNNISSNPTGGQRTVNVQFTTESGTMSNIATAFIQVNELPSVIVNLGENIEVCDGESYNLDAGNPGASYVWSTGETSQVIAAGNSGIYSVTVTDDVNCPGEDEVMVDVIPLIHVSLTGDLQICDNQNASITITTDSGIPVDVEIISSTGSFFSFSNVSGIFTFMDLLSDDTEYEITNVNPSQNACIELVDSVHVIDVYPSFIHSFNITICAGDSIWLGYYWETDAGVYENNFTTFEGCDSLVTTILTVSNAINITLTGTTCDSAEAGVFIEHLNNPDGCDTIIQTTISLLPPDTTMLAITDCNAADTGLFQQVLTNIAGCDSIVITDVSYAISPNSYNTVFTCDSSLLGIFQQLHIDQSGCDSIVVTTVLPANPDSTYRNTTSCDSSSLGVFQEHFTSSSGCDSIVFTTVTYSATDSTFLQNTTCDLDKTGVFVQSFVNQFGCDSVVTSIVTLLPSNETFISSTTCDPEDAGVFVVNLINQHGCDSVVTTTVTLLPSDETLINSSTCMSSEAGTFITIHQNQYGCDSIVTLYVALVPADTTMISLKTCDPSEVGSTETSFTNQDGCDSLIIEQTTLFPLPQLQLIVNSDFNGYDISCFGESDGSVSVEVTGQEPYAYLWSTGSTTQTITGLSAGSYEVTVTDGNGCTASNEVILFEPEEFTISFLVSQPDCFDQQDGSISVEQIGGIEPIRYSIDEINYQTSPVFNQLAGGTYTVTAIDANDCEVSEIIWINVPLMVHVELPDDQISFPGDTVIINAIVNVPFDSLASVTWSGLNNPICPNCLSQPVAPFITTTYSVTVTSLDGCMDEDAMTLLLESNDEIYVPNIFSPNGDNINDRLVINAGGDVQEIKSLIIFDRWGNEVFAANNFQANDLSKSWDGTLQGKRLNPGVFAYRMIVELKSKGEEIRYGDITLIR
jgi:gliding motility-associated-like protein